MKSAQKAIALALLASTAHTSTAGPLDWLADNPKTALVFAAGAGLWAGSKLWAGGRPSRVSSADDSADDKELARRVREIWGNIPEKFRPLVFALNKNPENPGYKCLTKETAPKIAHLISISAFFINHCTAEGAIILCNKDGAAITLSPEQRGRWFAPTDVTVCEETSVQGYSVLSWQPPKTKREKELAEVQEMSVRNAKLTEDATSETLAADATDGSPTDTESPADPLEKE